MNAAAHAKWLYTKPITDDPNSGEEVDVAKYIGSHECSNILQSLFGDNGKMRSGKKAILVKAIKDDTKK